MPLDLANLPAGTWVRFRWAGEQPWTQVISAAGAANFASRLSGPYEVEMAPRPPDRY